MGTSATVQKKMDSDSKFRDDVLNEQKVMDDTMGEFVKGFDDFVKNFYLNNNWEGYKSLGQGKKQDLQSSASFSLAQIETLITATANNLLAGNLGGLLEAPTEAAKNDIKAAGNAAAAVATGGDTAFIVSAAIATITDVLNLFDEGATGQIEQGMESHRIAPGLMLHAYGYSSTSSGNTTIDNASLIMSAIGYNICWCAAQQEVEQEMTFMSHISAQLRKDEAAIGTMRDKLNEMEEDPDIEDTKIANYKVRIADREAELDKFRAQADDLVKKFSKGKTTSA
jgi:hypothetical protein